MSPAAPSLFLGPRLTESVLLLDGITRAGKFLVGNILQELEGIEHYQYLGILEHLPYLERAGAIPPETSRAIARCVIDNAIYDQMVGRNLNLRRVDKSAIFNLSDHARYLERLEEGDDAAAMARLQSGRYCFPFIVHETLPNIHGYLELYPQLTVVHVERGPVDLVYSWYQRGFGRRWGNDSKLFAVALRAQRGGPIPWFAADWADEYLSLGEMDRVVRSMLWLFAANRAGYAALDSAQRARVVITSYERIIADTTAEIDRLSVQLGRRIKPQMPATLAKERLPGPHPRDSQAARLAVIESLTDRRAFDALLALDDRYRRKDAHVSAF